MLLWKFQGKRNYLGNLAQRGHWHSTRCYTTRERLRETWGYHCSDNEDSSLLLHDTDLSEVMLRPSSGFVYCIHPVDMVKSSSKTSITIYKLTLRHIPEES